MVKINNNIGVDHELSRGIVKDPVACSLLMYFMLDHPGLGSGGSSVSVQELSDYLGYSPKVVRKRIERLEDQGLITSEIQEFSGGERKPYSYELNFGSQLFVKPAKKAERKPETEEVEQMISKFTEINLRVHNHEFKPEDSAARKRWAEGAQKIITLNPGNEEFSMDTYEKVVEYLANQLKEFYDTGDKYKMKCKDLKNLVYTHPSQSDCKYIKAYEKMLVASNRFNQTIKEEHGQREDDWRNGGFLTGDIWKETGS